MLKLLLVVLVISLTVADFSEMSESDHVKRGETECFQFLVVEERKARQELAKTVGDLAEMLGELQKKVKLLSEESKKDNRVTYIRWGRRTCPGNGTDLVYTGYLGGSKDSDKGAAVNHLCLPKNPDWDHYEVNIETGANIYGGEYEFDTGNQNRQAHRFFDKHDLDEKPPVCAVCMSLRPSLIMIPGKNTCPGGWTKEYSGYLAASHRKFEAATEYICIDRHPEAGTDGKPNHGGTRLYLVEARCGTLPCPPYKHSRELTCVLCTK